MSHREHPQGPNPGQSAATPPGSAYRERLWVPVSWWLLAVPVVAVLGGYALYVGWRGPLAFAVYGMLTVFVAGFLLIWSAATIEVAGGVLRAGRDALAVRDTAEVTALDAEQSALLRGPRADPAAHLLLRPYLKRAVCVRLTDAASQAGGVPYWLVATRHPEALAAAITGAGQQGSTETRQRVG
jgi:hypothetical protein